MRPFSSLRLTRQISDTNSIDTFVIFVAANEVAPDALAALVDDEVERNLVPDEVVVVVRETARADVAKKIGSSVSSCAYAEGSLLTPP